MGKVKPRLLIVDDEDDIIDLLTYNLEREGYRVDAARTGEECLRRARERPPGLILLDLMLPGLDGFEVCKRLRKDTKTAHIPIIMITAKGEESDVVSGLEIGADDYVTKPFKAGVLLARVKSVLRRQNPEEKGGESDVITRGDIVINLGRREAAAAGKELDLTFSEFEVLSLLAKRPGWVYSRAQIVLAIKGEDYPVTERAIDVQIVGLRKKLGKYGDLIETVRGVGYRFSN